MTWGTIIGVGRVRTLTLRTCFIGATFVGAFCFFARRFVRGVGVVFRLARPSWRRRARQTRGRGRGWNPRSFGRNCSSFTPRKMCTWSRSSTESCNSLRCVGVPACQARRHPREIFSYLWRLQSRRRFQFLVPCVSFVFFAAEMEQIR